MPDNRAVAERRLHSLEKCLESEPDLNAKYRQTIDDDPQKGDIKKLSEKQSSEPTLRLWYLPCLVTRAVQLEVAKSLESDLFINVPRRFIARRGPPSGVFYDNGANFVGADRELKQSHSRRVEPLPDLRLPQSQTDI